MILLTGLFFARCYTRLLQVGPTIYFWTPCIYMIKSEKLTSFVDCSVMLILESVCVIDRTVGESG